ncbi:hypothetical protein RQP46_011061 [Phenoliferia psychrophenolica]
MLNSTQPHFSPAPPASSATIDLFPPETLEKIFKFARDAKTLTSCALVCRQWRDPAQRTLCRHLCFATLPTVRPDSVPEAQNAQKWLESPLRQRYRIDSVHLIVRSDSEVRFSSNGERTRSVHTNAAVEILEQCYGVKKLHIDMRTNCPEGSNYIDSGILFLPALSNLEELTLNSEDNFEEGYLAQEDELPFDLKTLTFLAFQPDDPYTLWDESRGGMSYRWPQQNCSNFLSVAFKSFAYSLTKLDLCGYHPKTTFLYLWHVFPCVAPTLRHLSVGLEPFPSTILPHFKKCTSLESLTIYFSPTNDSTETQSQRLQDFGTSLPLPSAGSKGITRIRLERLEHLDDHFDSMMDSVAKFLALPQLANIARIEIPHLDVSSFGEHSGDLAAAYAVNGCEVVFWEHCI